MATAKLKIETTNDTTKAEKSFDRVSAAAKKANAEIKKDGINVSEELAKKNKEGVNNLVGRFSWVNLTMKGISFIANGLIGGFRKILEEGNKMREMAKNIGISAETFAAMKARADVAGVSLEDFNKSLDALKNGRTSLDELMNSWRGVANATYGAREANDRFFDESGKNIEAVTIDRNIEKLDVGWRNLWRTSVSGIVRGLGFGTDAETTIEYAVQQGIRGKSGRDKAIRAAIKEQAYSPVEGTTMWRARYKELGDLFDQRVAAVDTERRNSRDDRIVNLYNRLGQDVGATVRALYRLGLGNFSDGDVSAAIERAQKRESSREKDERIVREILEEDQALKAKNEASSKRQEAIDKTLLSYAFAKGGGLLAGVNYGFLGNAQEQAEREKLVQLGKQTKSLAEVVAELKRVYTVLTLDN